MSQEIVREGVVTWTATFDDHPARVASRKSIETVSRKAKDEWLALYSDDCVVEDPVGPSPFDPSGEGHRGHERIAAFWDGTIATTERLDFDITASYAAGNECANVGTITAHLPGGLQLQTFGVYVYRVDANGRIESLRTYWEFERAMGTIGPEST